MSSAFPTVFVLVLVVGLNVIAYLFVPKGPQQTVLRAAIIMTVTSCYLAWAITYLAQLNPIIAPKRTVEN